MKRILLLLAVVAMLVFAFAPTAQAQAVSETFRERTEVSSTYFNPCTGEDIPYEGTLHLVGVFVLDSSGGLHFKGHAQFNAQGVSDTGAKYVFKNVVDSEGRGALDGSGALTGTGTVNGSAIRQGEDGTEEDYKTHIVFHVTQNANGEVTVFFERVEFECQ
jgi:hypothetical protein